MTRVATVVWARAPDDPCEVEVSYGIVEADPDTGIGDGAECLTVLSVDGDKTPAVIAEAQAWLDSNEKAQDEINAAAMEWLDDSDDWDL